MFLPFAMKILGEFQPSFHEIQLTGQPISSWTGGGKSRSTSSESPIQITGFGVSSAINRIICQM